MKVQTTLSQSILDHSRTDSQTVAFVEYLTLTDGQAHMLRVTIHSNNFYKSRSYGRVDRWDGSEWHNVVSSTTMLMEGGIGITYGWEQFSAIEKVALFRADRDRLVHIAEEVLEDLSSDAKARA